MLLENVPKYVFSWAFLFVLSKYSHTIHLVSVRKCCIVEHRFPHFTHQIGYHPTFSDIFDGFSRLSPLFARSPHIFVVSATIFSLTLRSSSKSWRLPQKCSVNGEKKRNPWKTVKNCRKMSGGTRLVRKMRKVMLNNPTSSKSVFIFNF